LGAFLTPPFVGLAWTHFFSFFSLPRRHWRALSGSFSPPLFFPSRPGYGPCFPPPRWSGFLFPTNLQLIHGFIRRPFLSFHCCLVLFVSLPDRDVTPASLHSSLQKLPFSANQGTDPPVLPGREAPSHGTAAWRVFSSFRHDGRRAGCILFLSRHLGFKASFHGFVQERSFLLASHVGALFYSLRFPLFLALRRDSLPYAPGQFDGLSPFLPSQVFSLVPWGISVPGSSVQGWPLLVTRWSLSSFRR